MVKFTETGSVCFPTVFLISNECSRSMLLFSWPSMYRLLLSTKTDLYPFLLWLIMTAFKDIGLFQMIHFLTILLDAVIDAHWWRCWGCWDVLWDESSPIFDHFCWKASVTISATAVISYLVLVTRSHIDT